MKTVLTPVDFSTTTSRVCTEAAALAKAVNGRMILLHSVSPPIVTTDLGPGIENVVELSMIAQKTAAKQIARLQKKLEQELVVTETLVLDGAPGPQIVEQAKKLGADYLVMGSHGHTALYDLLVGSTTHHVLKKAPCPVLVIPPPQKEKSQQQRKKKSA